MHFGSLFVDLNKKDNELISKDMSEIIFYIHTNVIRPFNIYGPGMYKYDCRMIPNMIRNHINNRQVELFSTGRQTCTYYYISDAINAILRVINIAPSGEAYNIGNDNPEISALNLIKIFILTIGKKVNFKLVE